MYSIDQSPLYKLRNKRKLSSFFGLKLCDLNKLLSKGSDNYRIFYIKKLGKKPRQVQAPKPILKRIHNRLFEFLKRIEIPDYMYSGMKGRSYIDNAKSHIGIEPLIKLDISDFFPSTKRHHIYDFFCDVM